MFLCGFSDINSSHQSSVHFIKHHQFPRHQFQAQFIAYVYAISSLNFILMKRNIVTFFTSAITMINVSPDSLFLKMSFAWSIFQITPITNWMSYQLLCRDIVSVWNLRNQFFCFRFPLKTWNITRRISKTGDNIA